MRILKQCSLLLILFFTDELMRSMQQVKRILQAKWSKTGAEISTQQEDLTAEAERILKKTQSNQYLCIKPLSFNRMIFSENRVSGYTTDYVNKMIAKYS